MSFFLEWEGVLPCDVGECLEEQILTGSIKLLNAFLTSILC